MRTALKQALGLVSDTLTDLYDAILATEPTVPLLFRLPEYRGQQVLFHDSACTVPVGSIGDPVGGVRHPETGAILATQSVDGSRPIWGGRDVGAVVSTSQHMLVSLAACADLLPRLNHEGGTLAGRCTVDAGTNRAVFGGINTSSLGYSYRFYSDGVAGRSRSFRRPIGASVTANYSEAHAIHEPFTFALVTEEDSTTTAYGAGNVVTSSATTTEPGPSWTTPPAVGSINDGGIIVQPFAGVIDFLLLFDRPLTAQDFARLEAL